MSPLPFSRWWIGLAAAVLGVFPLVFDLPEGSQVWPGAVLVGGFLVGLAALGSVRSVLVIGLALTLARWGQLSVGWAVAWGAGALAVLMADGARRWPERWTAEDVRSTRRADRAWIGRHLVRWVPLVLILALLLPALVHGLDRPPDPEIADDEAAAGENGRAKAYWGFFDRMDTSARGELGNQRVMRVWADRPDFWRGQTFDHWDGRYWTARETLSVPLSDENPKTPLPGFGDVETAATGPPSATSSQTFELVGVGSDVVFGAYRPVELVLPQVASSRIGDGSIVSEWMPAGSVYRVESERIAVTPDLLRRHDPADADLPPILAEWYLDDAAVTDRVRALAEEITADAPTTYDKIRSLEAWMADNIRYTRDIPVPPEGADAVEQLVFVDKAGFCEQIGTALTVMMRVLGVPSRLAVGYVTGEKVGVDEYLVRSKDAHAWVEVWFPGLGWQGFDPTASVPLAGEASVNEVGIPWPAIGLAVGALVLIVLGQWWWRRRQARRDESDGGSGEPYRRPPSVLTTALVEEGTRRGIERRPSETVQELAHRVVAESKGDDRFVSVAELATRASFGPAPLAPADEHHALEVIAELGREDLVGSGPPDHRVGAQ